MEDSARPKEVENFEDAFITVKLDMTGKDYGKGFTEDLSTAQELASSVLRKRRECWNRAQFKAHLEYDFIMAKDHDGAESMFRISSTGGGNGTADVVRKNSDCDNVIKRAYEKLIQALQQLAARGSGWSFRRSVQMRILMERIVTGIPLTGDNDDKVREQIERQDRRKNVEDMAVDEDEDDEDMPGPMAPMGAEALATYTSLAQKGGSYCPLPKWMNRLPKGTTFNPRSNLQEDNQKCFLWALLAAEYPFGAISYAKFDAKYIKRSLNKCNINHLKDALTHGAIQMPALPPSTTFPVSLDDRFFETVEMLNDERFSFSVYAVGYREGDVQPFYASKHKRKDKPHLRLLLIPNGKAVPGPIKAPGRPGVSQQISFEAPIETFHFATLHDPIPLLGKVRTSKQRLQDYVSKYGLKESDIGTFYCDSCFCRFAKEEGPGGLRQHEQGCIHGKPTLLTLPAMSERFLQFEQYYKLEPCPFVIYADTEAVNHPITQIDTDDMTTVPDAQNATEVIQKHVPCGYAYIIVPRPEYEGKLPANLPFSLKIQSSIGAGAMDQFMTELIRDCKHIDEWLHSEAADVYPVYKNEDGEIVDPGVKKALISAERCRFCQMPLPDAALSPDDLRDQGIFHRRRVADHDHITGEFRGVAHDKCNLEASALKRFRVPILFHNLKVRSMLFPKRLNNTVLTGLRRLSRHQRSGQAGRCQEESQGDRKVDGILHVVHLQGGRRGQHDLPRHQSVPQGEAGRSRSQSLPLLQGRRRTRAKAEGLQTRTGLGRRGGRQGL